MNTMKKEDETMQNIDDFPLRKIDSNEIINVGDILFYRDSALSAPTTINNSQRMTVIHLTKTRIIVYDEEGGCELFFRRNNAMKIYGIGLRNLYTTKPRAVEEQQSQMKDKPLKRAYTPDEIKQVIEQLNAIQINGEPVFRAKIEKWVTSLVRTDGAYISIDGIRDKGNIFLALQPKETAIERE